MKRVLTLILAGTLALPALADEAPKGTELTEAVQAAKSAAESAKMAAEAVKSMAEAMKALQPPPPPPPPPAPAPKPPEAQSPWTYQVGLNVISITGNATNVASKLSYKVDGKWGDWALLVKGGAAYGQAALVADGPVTITSLNGDTTVRGDRTFDKTFVAFVQTGVLGDHVASIEYQAFGEAGLGMKWWDVSEGEDKEKFTKSRLTTDLGFRYTRESQFKYFPAEGTSPSFLLANNIIALRGSLSFKYAITRTSLFAEDFEILPDVRDSTNLRWTSSTALSAQLDKGFALQVAFKARYLGKPAAGAKTMDTELGAGVTFAF